MTSIYCSSTTCVGLRWYRPLKPRWTESVHTTKSVLLCNSCRDYGNTMNRLQTINWTERSIQRSQWSSYWGMSSSTPTTNPRQKEICQRTVSQLLVSDQLKFTNRRSTRRLLLILKSFSCNRLRLFVLL